MAINPWVGYEADAYVVGHIAENELGCTVNYKDLKEDVSWQGFGTGEVDVVDRGLGPPGPGEEVHRRAGRRQRQDFGPTGNVGIIGWYVPPWLAEEHPDILDWENLNKYADEFATSESGDKGQFLGADPSYVQFDEAIVKNLDLDFKVVVLRQRGGAASRRSSRPRRTRSSLIGYFYEPQWFFAEMPLAAGRAAAVRRGLRGRPGRGRLRLPAVPR